jgi:UDP-N-acetylmuramate dehydrogenase
MFDELAPLLKQLMPDLRGRMFANQDMSGLTWFRVGGIAQVMFAPDDEDDLCYFLKLLPREVPLTIVGVGSNLIVRDGGLQGVVIRMTHKGFGHIEHEGETMLRVGTATLDKKLADFAAHSHLAGLEFFSGIPGSIGGALRMNAGANGGETKDILVEARGVNRAGDIKVFKNFQMGFTYRHCDVGDDVIFTSALFRGVKDEPEAIAERMNAVKHHRETVQPIREKTGGSTFKNPQGHSAWRLIDGAGCRGLKIGGAQVSEMHCNFLINMGEATAADIEMLGETVRAKVKAQSGIELTWEIKRVGRPLKSNPLFEFTDWICTKDEAAFKAAGGIK